MLLFILITLLLAKALIPVLISSPEPDFTEFGRMVMALEKARHESQKARDKVDTRSPEFKKPDREIAAIKLNPFIFDPNQMTEEMWIELGLNTKQIRNIQNFITRGGKFRQKEDFKRIFTISKEEFEILEPFIQIAAINVESNKDFASGKTTGHTSTYEKPESINLIDINKADSIQLLAVPGIGPAFAHRIIKYREMLGGYHTASQLLEVYGFDSVRFNQVARYFTFDHSSMRLIDINKADVKQLAAHPYIDFYLAKSIVDHRIKKGKVNSDSDLYGIPLMHDALFQKLTPYFHFE